jgi:hypothetical protein
MLSLLWVTQLIWIICRPKSYMIYVQAVLLFLVFTVRYNSLYYPLIASGVLLMCRLQIQYKIVGILLQFILGRFCIIYPQ